jgi:hypothetical protein
VATGAEGTVVGGAKAEPAPVLEDGDVVEEDSVEGVDTAGGLTDAAAASEGLAWLGVSWKANAIKTPVDAVAPTAIRRVVALTRPSARSRPPGSWR